MRLSCESDAAQQSKGDAKDGGVHALAEPCEAVDPGPASCEGNSTIQRNAGDACEWCGRGCDGWRRTGVDSGGTSAPESNYKPGRRDSKPCAGHAGGAIVALGAVRALHPWRAVLCSPRCSRERAVAHATGERPAATARSCGRRQLLSEAAGGRGCDQRIVQIRNGPWRRFTTSARSNTEARTVHHGGTPRTLFFREEDAVSSVRLRVLRGYAVQSGRRQVSAARRVRFPAPAACWRAARVPRRRRG
jgi:hypothetical protein